MDSGGVLFVDSFLRRGEIPRKRGGPRRSVLSLSLFLFFNYFKNLFFENVLCTKKGVDVGLVMFRRFSAMHNFAKMNQFRCNIGRMELQEELVVLYS